MLTLKAAVVGLLASAGISGTVNPDQFYCLTEAVYFESRGEPEVGKRAVAHNVLNRTKSGEFPDTVCGVVKQRLPGARTHQYSYRDDLPRRVDLSDPSTKEELAESAKVAYKALAGKSKDPTNGALYFYSTRAVKRKPHWARGMKMTVAINDHKFYKPKPSR